MLPAGFLVMMIRAFCDNCRKLKRRITSSGIDGTSGSERAAITTAHYYAGQNAINAITRESLAYLLGRIELALYTGLAGILFIICVGGTLA